MLKFQANKLKKVGREALIIVVGVFLIIYIMGTVQAGSLSPLAAPASTLKTLQEIFNPLASSSYNSASVVASPNGNALQIMKCIISKLNTGACP